MKVEFYLRIPGNHQLACTVDMEVVTVDMEVVPRVGESVTISDEYDGLEVHSVNYDIPQQSVQVLLRV